MEWFFIIFRGNLVWIGSRQVTFFLGTILDTFGIKMGQNFKIFGLYMKVEIGLKLTFCPFQVTVGQKFLYKVQKTINFV